MLKKVFRKGAVFLLAVLLLLTAVPVVSVFAARTTVLDPDCDSFENREEGIFWEKATSTLTLENAVIEVSSGDAVRFPAGGTIVLKGENHIKGAIVAGGALQITGTGSLVAEDSGAVFHASAVSAPDFRIFNRSGQEIPSVGDESYLQFRPKTFTVTLTALTGGNCNFTEKTFVVGERVEIAATAEPGYQFSGWVCTTNNLNVESGASELSFTMPAEDVALTAQFTPASSAHSVTVELSEIYGGRVTLSHKTAKAGEIVSVTIVVSDGYTFNGWGTTDIELEDKTLEHIEFVMPDRDVTLAAQLTANIYHFTVKAGDGGNVRIQGREPNERKEYEFRVGEEIEIVALPAEGFVFGGWSATGGADFLDFGSEVTMVICPASNFTLTAQFASSIKELTLAATEGGTITPAPGKTKYGVDSILDLTAVPDDGWSFSRWECSSPKGSFSDSTSPETTFTMPDEDCTVTAVFVKSGYRLTVKAGTGGSVMAENGSYEMGTVIPLRAEAEAGYRFLRWEADVEGILADPNAAETTLTMPSSSCTVNAVFALESLISDLNRTDGEEDDATEGFPWLALVVIFLISVFILTLIIVRERYNLSYWYLTRRFFRKLFHKM